MSGSSKYSPTVSYKTLPEAPGKMEKPRLVGKAKTHTFTVTWGKNRYFDLAELFYYEALNEKSQPVLSSTWTEFQTVDTVSPCIVYLKEKLKEKRELKINTG